MRMQKRGGKFWLWADCMLKAEGRQAQSQKGSSIEVQARTDRGGCTQMFIGVYDASGIAVCEEFYPRLTGDTVDEALEWGIRRCEVLIEQTAPFTAPHRIRTEITPLAVRQELAADAAEDAEHRAREAFLAARNTALAEYALAKAALMAIMRSGKSDSQRGLECVRRLNAAVDAWACLPRQYVAGTPAASSVEVPGQTSPGEGYLSVEELEHHGLGVGFPRIQAR